MSGTVASAAAAAVVVLQDNHVGLPTIDPLACEGSDSCPDCNSTKRKAFLARKRLVECANCGRVYRADTDITD